MPVSYDDPQEHREDIVMFSFQNGRIKLLGKPDLEAMGRIPSRLELFVPTLGQKIYRFEQVSDYHKALKYGYLMGAPSYEDGIRIGQVITVKCMKVYLPFLCFHIVHYPYLASVPYFIRFTGVR